MLFKAILAIALTLVATGVSAAPTVTPFSTQANVAIVQNPDGSGDSRLFFQQNSGEIALYSISGTFDTGFIYTNATPVVIASKNEVLRTTPIAARVLGLDEFTEIHVFFLSPNFVLSEYYWTPTAWKGGSNCPECVTAQQFHVSQDTTTLSATIDSVNNVISVIFIDADDTSTLTQAIRKNGTWTKAPLPDPDNFEPLPSLGFLPAL